MTTDELLKKKQNNLAAAPEKLVIDIEKSEAEIYGKLIPLLSRLRLDSEGRIIIDKQNLAIGAEIDNELKSIVLTKQFLTGLKQFSNDFNRQAEFTNQYYKKTFGNYKIPPSAEAVLQSAKSQALHKLIGLEMESNFIKPISDLINNAISSGALFQSLLDDTRIFILGK